MAQLRALYLPHINHPRFHDLKDLAMQILDIVSIRPELKVTYIGIQTNCYQIREEKSEPKSSESELASDGPASQTGFDFFPFNGGFGDFPFNWADGDEDEDEDQPDQDPLDQEDPESELSDSDADEKSSIHFSLREILFYDDQVSIFKARHGSL